uniref:PAX-interacting protein 1 n=1 Tax=Lygus hesperus TaxID=30085 RepID=A0A0A9XDH1_LYGHE
MPTQKLNPTRNRNETEFKTSERVLKKHQNLRAQEGTGSQEISIESMASRLQGAMKSKMKRDEESIQQSDRRGRTRQNAVGPNTEMKEGEHIRDGIAEKGSVGGNISGSPSLISLKKEVKKKGRPRKAVNKNEETLEKTEENVPNIELSKSTTSSVRRGRRKLDTAQEDSITVSSETQAPSTSLEVPAPKRGRRAKNVVADNNDEATGLSDSQNAPSASKSNINVSKTKRCGKTTPSVEDSSAFETDLDSQDLSQGRRSGRARKKKETFDEIMSRKEEEIKLKKLQRHSALSQSPDTSRSTSRASVASSSKTEEDRSVMSAPKRRGRPKKSVPGTSASTSSVLSVDDDAPFSVPPSPAGSNSSRRKTPRPGSSSSIHSVNSETPQKLKEESQNSMSASVVKVMFTGLADAKLSSMVKKLGGKVVEKPTDCTVLVTDKVRRTVKFLCALGLGKPIVSPNWLSKSKSFNKFTDTSASLLQDNEAEEKFDFELKESLEKAKNSRLLEGYSFYATPSVLPPPAEIKPIVECSGGTYLAKPPAKWASNAAIISSPKDKSDWTKLTKHGVLPPILSAEALLSGVLQQKFDFGKHRLK